jgi:hypothetical protein
LLSGPAAVAINRAQKSYRIAYVQKILTGNPRGKNHEQPRKTLHICLTAVYDRALMPFRQPEITIEQITKWILLSLHPPLATDPRGPLTPLPVRPREHSPVDFQSVRQALNRAHAKTSIRTIAPFRRLRRNQGAVNESLISSIRSLVKVNKKMEREIELLHADLSNVCDQLAELRAITERESGQQPHDV